MLKKQVIRRETQCKKRQQQKLLIYKKFFGLFWMLCVFFCWVLYWRESIIILHYITKLFTVTVLVLNPYSKVSITRLRSTPAPVSVRFIHVSFGFGVIFFLLDVTKQIFSWVTPTCFSLYRFQAVSACTHTLYIYRGRLLHNFFFFYWFT